MSSTKLVVFSSGSGTTFQAITEACRSGELNAEVMGLVTSRTGTGAEDRAVTLAVPTFTATVKRFGSVTEVDQKICEHLEALSADWIVLAGYMRAIGPKILQKFPGRITNIHPSLLPKFGGQGMYGSQVHQAVIEANQTTSGATVHIVTQNYDEGPVVLQKSIQIPPGTSWEELEKKVKLLEKPLYIQALQKLIST